MNVCVIGTGYVGLVTGACFAEFGVSVVCADKDTAKVATLQAGEVPVYRAFDAQILFELTYRLTGGGL